MLTLLNWSLRPSFTDHGDLRIRSLLCAECNLVKASLGFVVDASRTLGVTTERDRAKRLGLGDWRRRRCDGYGRGARCCLTLIIGDVSGDVIVPAGAPVVVRVAVLPVPLIDPAEEVKL